MSYARSDEHLTEVVDSVCKNFEDYAQATAKVARTIMITLAMITMTTMTTMTTTARQASGAPTIIRLMTLEGNMNPRMAEVDIVPDDDLNTRLKFYVSTDSSCTLDIITTV